MSRYHVHLEKRDPERNQCRFYALHAMPTLFGDWTLVREWGRIGCPGRFVVDWFETLEATQTALARKAQQKRKRGYGPVGQPPGGGHGTPPRPSSPARRAELPIAPLPLFERAV